MNLSRNIIQTIFVLITCVICITELVVGLTWWFKDRLPTTPPKWVLWMSIVMVSYQTLIAVDVVSYTVRMFWNVDWLWGILYMLLASVHLLFTILLFLWIMKWKKGDHKWCASRFTAIFIPLSLFLIAYPVISGAKVQSIWYNWYHEKAMKRNNSKKRSRSYSSFN